MLPERIGRYDVRGLAGSGGFATVYEGFDPRLDARVAIKVLADNWASDPEIRRRFRQEAVLLRRLHTEQGVPGLVEVFDVDQTETGQPFFVMGWAGSGTLAARAGRKVWSGESLRPVIVAMTQSLGHLHARGVVHRDIKPQNLLLRANRKVVPSDHELIAPGERLVVGDFGLAKDLAADASTLSFVGGTERYMAPEQLVFGGPVDHRADIYAATAMIEELLTGRGQYEPAPALRVVLQRGMASEPEHRFANMADWQAALLEGIKHSREYQPEPVTQPAPLGSGDPYPDDPPTAAPSLVQVGQVAAAEVPPSPLPVPHAEASPVTVAAAVAASNPTSGVIDRSKAKPKIGPIVGVVLAVAAVLAAFVFLPGDNNAVAGPATIESGETVTYRIDEEATNISWIDPSGQVVQARTLDVTGRLPGQLSFSAIIDGTQVQRTVVVEASESGPTIVGPQSLPTGAEATFQAEVPAGHTFFWIHPTRGTVSTQELVVRQDGNEFIVGLISIDPTGVERGDQVLVSSN